jgi:beta-mannosidase
MNMVRVWGGGSYLGGDFYDVADEMGILVWQEVMFACAVYPAWPEFTASVRDEIVQQTRRLSAHPSLVLWCGNNEAETMDMDMYEGAWAQYYSLAYDVIIDTLKNVTKGSIELWPSSPSNGFQTTWSSPKDATRGDVHHYVYDGDCTDSSLYGEMPRFQSEFGFPSYPGEAELAPFVVDEATDLKTHSLFHIARQDLNCPLSNATINVSGYGTGKKHGCDFPMQERLLPTYSSKGWADQSLDGKQAKPPSTTVLTCGSSSAYRVPC